MVGATLDWTKDLEGWLTPFLDGLGHKTRRQMCPVYVSGLIGPGDRKSIQPMAERLARGSYDRLHHFISSGVWDAAPVETELLVQADKLVGGRDVIGRPSALDVGQKRKIAERYAAGETMAQLAAEYEVGEATIFRALQGPFEGAA
jgi:SRSO17 transposase